MWLRGKSADSLRQSLVDKLIRDGHVRDERLGRAFRTVPRERFVPDASLEEAYSSSDAIVTKRVDGIGVSSASAPDVIAIMLEQLELRPGQRVLEIGAGTGYNAALIGQIVGDEGRVVSIDIDEDLVEGARAHLAAIGCDNVEVVCADGAFGYAAAAPFDRIMLSVAAADIAPSWREQLATGGRLVLPLSLHGPQRSIAFVPAEDCLCSVSIHSCSFISLRGVSASGTLRLPLGADGAIVAGVSAAAVGEPARLQSKLAALLGEPSRELSVGISATPYELADGLGLWLALGNEDLLTLWADSSAESGRPVPALLGNADRWHASVGVLRDDSLALLAATGSSRREGEPTRYTLAVRAYGPSLAPAERMRDQLRAWEAAGRPGDRGLRVRAYPATSTAEPLGPGAVIQERWTRLVVDWVDQF